MVLRQIGMSFSLIGISMSLVGCFGKDDDKITTSKPNSDNTIPSESDNDSGTSKAFEIDLESAWDQAYPNTQGKPQAKLETCNRDKALEGIITIKNMMADTGTNPTAFDVDQELDRGFEQIKCGTIEVPQDWGKPTEEKMSVSFYYRPVTNAKGTIFYNPGGPGAAPPISSALLPTELFSVYGNSETFDYAFPEISQFNFVGIINRGIANEEGVTEDDGAILTELCSDTAVIKPEELKNVTREQPDKYESLAIQQFAKCLPNKSKLKTMGTDQVINDYDSIREALDIDRIDFFGVSYGTLIGQLYASKFPDNLRTLMLDANVITTAEKGLSVESLPYRVDIIKAIFDECDAKVDCPFRTSDGTKSFERFETLLSETKNKDLRYYYYNEESGENEIATFENIGFRAFSSIPSSKLHGGKDFLLIALKELSDKHESGDILQSQFWARFDKYPISGKLSIAYTTIATMDGLFYKDPRDIIKENNNLSVSEDFKDSIFLTEKTSVRVPFLEPWRSRPFKKITADVPALVLSTQYDLATPLEWSLEVADAFPNSRFILSKYGFGHGVIGSNDCASRIAVDYISTTDLPGTNITCDLSAGQSSIEVD